MRFLFLTALLLLRLSPVTQTRRYRFSKLDIYNALSRNQISSIFQDAEGVVWFSAIQALTVKVDAHVNFFTSNRMIVSGAGTDRNFVVTGGANFLPC